MIWQRVNICLRTTFIENNMSMTVTAEVEREQPLVQRTAIRYAVGAGVAVVVVGMKKPSTIICRVLYLFTSS